MRAAGTQAILRGKNRVGICVLSRHICVPLTLAQYHCWWPYNQGNALIDCNLSQIQTDLQGSSRQLEGADVYFAEQPTQRGALRRAAAFCFSWCNLQAHTITVARRVREIIAGMNSRDAPAPQSWYPTDFEYEGTQCETKHT